jgi:hypothetical protein
MKYLPILALALLLVLSVAAPATAQNPVDSPLPGGPVDDITTDFENLPAYFGLGAVVSLLIMVARRVGLPDGWGGYANLIVGIIAFAVVKLTGDSADRVFELARELAEVLLLVMGGQLFHASAKYARLDKLWKARDGQ